MAATELMERTELQPQKAMLELSETCPPRTALSTNPAQPTQPAQRWTINSSSKSADRSAANQTGHQSHCLYISSDSCSRYFAHPTFLLILESKESQMAGIRNDSDNTTGKQRSDDHIRAYRSKNG
ncbi:hypothetical protein [Bifidobacterium pseudocatenulatum]|uniref:hypothetical protein n=1 Tax=Bifidobacterium pseudocatenulatum TaxID=28026 RepID=UPI0022E67102|nr:hypothetical protein [Bifidobacterium pseudocatenulatum]